MDPSTSSRDTHAISLPPTSRLSPRGASPPMAPSDGRRALDRLRTCDKDNAATVGAVLLHGRSRRQEAATALFW